jgi:Peptidase C13 family
MAPLPPAKSVVFAGCGRPRVLAQVLETPGLRRGLLRNLGGGLLLLGLRRLAPERFVRSFDQLAALLVLNLLVWAGLDTLHSETGSRLALDGLYGWAFYLLLALFGLGLVARAYSRQADTRGLLIPALSVSPYVLTIFWLLGDLSQVNAHPAVETVAAVFYLIILSVRVMQAAYTTARGKAVVLAVMMIIAAPYVLQGLDLDTRLWLTEDVDDTQPDDASGAEALLYDQPARIVASVEHMAPRQPGRPNVFYLGFAGDGEQEIFKREALFAQDVLGEHFSSGERSAELINDEDDRDSYPIASVSGLQQALKLIASRMDPEQDVLVLMLTSHGSRDGVAVINGSLPLAQLGPAELQHALETSGVKWRVVIVSACYAGVFVDALKNDDTLVITAADASHSSFGCDDNRELTYFGEAFLQESLPTAKSLEEAFKKAAGLIQKRESAEHLEHSNPQLFVGEHIRGKLAGLESGVQQPGHATIVANQ